MSFLMTFCTLLVNVLCSPLHLIHAVGLYETYKRFFPLCLYWMSAKYNKKMYEQKKELFRRLPEFSKPGGQLTILEIGCGTGTNFEFFPPGCKVICTDPNPHFQKYLTESMEQNEQLTYERFVVASGEDMGSVEEESIDVVVCTLVLCSVTDIPQTLREVQRILRPVLYQTPGSLLFLALHSSGQRSQMLFLESVGAALLVWLLQPSVFLSPQGGALFFIDHVAADESTWTHFFQHVFQPAWHYFGDGCKVTRETWKHVEAAGFSELKLRHIETPLMFMIKPHIIGYAIK